MTLMMMRIGFKTRPQRQGTRKKEVKYDTRQPAVGWGRRRVVGHAREVLPDIDAFHLGVEPFCKQRRGVNYSCQVQSHLFMCSLFQQGRQLGVCIRQRTALTIVFGVGGEVSFLSPWPESAAPRRQDLLYRMRGGSDQNIYRPIASIKISYQQSSRSP